MNIHESDSPVSKMRDKLGWHLAEGFAEFTGGRRPAIAAYPWSSTDTPRIVIHQDLNFNSRDDDAGPCLNVCRFIAMFVAGDPGGDTTGRQADHWDHYLLQGDVFDGIESDDWWNSSEPIPVVERIGGFRIYPLFDGQMWASETTIRTEIHMTERAD